MEEKLVAAATRCTICARRLVFRVALIRAFLSPSALLLQCAIKGLLFELGVAAKRLACKRSTRLMEAKSDRVGTVAPIRAFQSDVQFSSFAFLRWPFLFQPLQRLISAFLFSLTVQNPARLNEHPGEERSTEALQTRGDVFTPMESSWEC